MEAEPEVPTKTNHISLIPCSSTPSKSQESPVINWRDELTRGSLVDFDITGLNKWIPGKLIECNQSLKVGKVAYNVLGLFGVSDWIDIDMDRIAPLGTKATQSYLKELEILKKKQQEESTQSKISETTKIIVPKQSIQASKQRDQESKMKEAKASPRRIIHDDEEDGNGLSDSDDDSQRKKSKRNESKTAPLKKEKEPQVSGEKVDWKEFREVREHFNLRGYGHPHELIGYTIIPIPKLRLENVLKRGIITAVVCKKNELGEYLYFYKFYDSTKYSSPPSDPSKYFYENCINFLTTDKTKKLVKFPELTQKTSSQKQATEKRKRRIYWEYIPVDEDEE